MFFMLLRLVQKPGMVSSVGTMAAKKPGVAGDVTAQVANLEEWTDDTPLYSLFCLTTFENKSNNHTKILFFVSSFVCN